MTGSTSRVVVHLVAALALLALLPIACGGRNLEDLLDPGNDAEGGNDAGGSAQGGSGGEGLVGAGGEGLVGSGGEGPGAGGSSTGPGTPLDCFSCIGDNCPDALACITDPVCAQGIGCAVTTCLTGGNPDIACFIGCFNGDFEAAFQAFQAIQCVFGSCIDQCGGLFGGGFPGP